MTDQYPPTTRRNLPQITRKDLQRELYKRSFFEFFKAAFPVLVQGADFQDNFHIQLLCDILQKEAERIIAKRKKKKDIIIKIPPRCTKSLICSVIFPVWCWVKQPSLKIITVSYTQDISKGHALDSKRLIESEWFQALFSDAFQLREDANRTDEYHTSSFGLRIAVGIDGAITGKGGDIILLDHPQDPSKAESENRKESVIDYYNKTLYNRLDHIQVGLRFIIQQRLHEQDLTGYLLEKNPEEYTHICLPAESSEHVSPESLKAFYQDNLLDPVRFPKPELEKLKRTMGSTNYSGQYGQSPVPSDGLIFKRDWFLCFPWINSGIC